jgi:Mor family transcriptional regulator
MGVNNQPQDDAKAMTAEYVKGATIADLALKYNHSEQEVETVVTKDADTEELPTQAQEDSKPAEAPKKDK